MPDVPTMIVSGFPNFEAVSWIGFLARSGTPMEAIDRYNKEIVAILNRTEIRKKLEEIDLEVIANSPSQYAAFIDKDIKLYSALIKSGNFKE